MISFKYSISPLENSTGIFVGKYISVQAAAELTGYNIQYLRRLLRSSKLEGIKIGQLWLIEMHSLETYLQHVDISNGRSLVIDIGGFTTDYLAVNPGGEVDYSLARSVPIGIQNVVTDFEESFRANNLEAVKDSPVLSPERIRQAIATGIFKGGGRQYPCESEVKEATNMLLNRVVDTYQRIAGGSLSWDAIILTGGGIALLYKRLLPVLNQENIILADKLESIYLANVRGGLKLWRLYEALQML